MCVYVCEILAFSLLKVDIFLHLLSIDIYFSQYPIPRNYYQLENHNSLYSKIEYSGRQGQAIVNYCIKILAI